MDINVSVIIPTFNRAKYIQDAIQSVLNQTYPNYEILVVDDGSTDDTRQIVAAIESEKIRYYYKCHQGIALSLNYGINHSRGHFIARLDSDDIFLPEKLGRQVQLLEENPDVDLVYTQVYKMTEDGKILSRYPEGHRLPPEPLRALRNFLFAPSQSLMFRRECIEQAGVFDENFVIASDWDFFIRLAMVSKLAYINEPLVKTRTHSGMITRDGIQKMTYIIAVLEKHRETLSLAEDNRWLSPHYYKLGREYFFVENYDLAQSAFQKALALSPTNVSALLFFLLCFFPPDFIARLKHLQRSIKIKNL
jgi:glycosyltransferase involved in cell wall biosynthesis